MFSQMGRKALLVALLGGMSGALVADGLADQRNELPVSQWSVQYDMSEMIERMPATSAGSSGMKYRSGTEYSDGYYDSQYELQERKADKSYREHYPDASTHKREQFGPNQ